MALAWIRESYKEALNGAFNDSDDIIEIGRIVDNADEGEEIEALQMISDLINKEG